MPKVFVAGPDERIMAKFLDVGSINRAPKALTKDSLWDLPEPPIAGE
jgi:hypothetical protein